MPVSQNEFNKYLLKDSGPNFCFRHWVKEHKQDIEPALMCWKNYDKEEM